MPKHACCSQMQFCEQTNMPIQTHTVHGEKGHVFTDTQAHTPMHKQTRIYEHTHKHTHLCTNKRTPTHRHTHTRFEALPGLGVARCADAGMFTDA